MAGDDTLSPAERSGVVLVGGRSSRMGTDKSRVHVGGRSMLALVLAAFAPVARDLLVLAGVDVEALPDTNPPASDETSTIRVLRDSEPFLGPLPALTAGLEAARAPIALVAACDLPLLRSAVLGRLAELLEASDQDAVIPRIDGRPQPLCAAYRTAGMARQFRAAVSRGERSPLRALQGARVLEPTEDNFRDLDPELLSFRNVNDPAELEAVRRIALQQDRTGDG